MSVQAITSALIIQGVRDTEKLLLIVLANYADENMQCWPSQERLAKDTCMSVRSVGRCFAGLEKVGYVERHQRRRDDGFRASDLIVLRLDSPAIMSHDSLSPDKQSHDKSAHLTRQKRRISHDRLAEPTSFEPTIEPSVEPSKKRAREDSFDIFWKTYPHKVGKGDARNAFVKAITRSDLLTMLDGVRRYIASKPPDRAWCNPATWLNQDRWEDEPATAPKSDHERNLTSFVEGTRDFLAGFGDRR